MTYTIGVDIGGTKVATAIVDQYGSMISKKEVISNPIGKEEMFLQVIKSIDAVLDTSNLTKDSISRIGVGVPGKVDSEKGIAVFQNNLPWRNFPLVDRLREHFLTQDIVIDNDVYMAAYAEWRKLCACKQDTFVYVTVSTGISCSTIHHSSFLRGGGFAGELGLYPVISNSSPNGINQLEQVASGLAIQKLAQKQFGNKHMTTRDLFNEFHKDNKIAKEIIKDVTESLAHAIYALVCLLDPNKIVLGGGVINHQPFLLNLVKNKLKRFLMVEQQHVLRGISTSYYKGDSGIIGAAMRIKTSNNKEKQGTKLF
ncbi:MULTISPECIES: ROK family protein [Clostridia]|uniref:ROK family protein n=1 Tax=Clostridia TaxID=186801 RepID=UPI000EA25325|nr:MULTISPECIES: ROK family protein [Clostridia]NBJ68841.1 ROK family protein [Roseburia sp. 1XD42-34]RKI80219.1 ROK family protein [Clostridium sp. 1xD42-85]